LNHRKLLAHYTSHPQLIEDGFRILYSEFSIGKGRVDILGVDKQSNICLVEVKTDNDSGGVAVRQIKRYGSALLGFLSKIGVEKKVRCFIANPDTVTSVGEAKYSQPLPGGVPMGLPTSRELYGMVER